MLKLRCVCPGILSKNEVVYDNVIEMYVESFYYKTGKY